MYFNRWILEDPPADEKNSALDTAFTYVLATLIFFLMLGMGATVTLQNAKDNLKNPKPFIIGFSSQYLFMPLLSFILALILPISDLMSIGLILTGCSPGGTTSNLFAYWSKGDLPLSIIMTVASTTAAFGMLPLLALIYTIPFTSESVKIPFGNIAQSLALAVVPIAIGIFIRHKSEKWAKIVEKVGSIVGVIVILVALIIGGIQNPELFDDDKVPGSLWGAAALLPFLGAIFGYGLGYLLRLNRLQQRTVSLETGIQNSSLTIALITFSFDLPQRTEVLYYPLLYSLWLFIDAAILASFFVALDKYFWKDSKMLEEVTELQEHKDVDTRKV